MADVFGKRILVAGMKQYYSKEERFASHFYILRVI